MTKTVLSLSVFIVYFNSLIKDRISVAQVGLEQLSSLSVLSARTTGMKHLPALCLSLKELKVVGFKLSF